jgi:hypothetical protein
MEFNSANSNFRLFCNGVPVIKSRPREMNDEAIYERSESTFLMLCASSIAMYSKLNFLKAEPVDQAGLAACCANSEDDDTYVRSII